MGQELDIPRRSSERGPRQAKDAKSTRTSVVEHRMEYSSMYAVVPHNTALTDLSLSDFKLRFDQRYALSAATEETCGHREYQF